MALATPRIAVDLRIVAVDLLPDALGWALVAVAAWRLDVPAAGLLALAAGDGTRRWASPRDDDLAPWAAPSSRRA